jgi:hypothetical protein
MKYYALGTKIPHSSAQFTHTCYEKFTSYHHVITYLGQISGKLKNNHKKDSVIANFQNSPTQTRETN